MINFCIPHDSCWVMVSRYISIPNTGTDRKAFYGYLKEWMVYTNEIITRQFAMKHGVTIKGII